MVRAWASPAPCTPPFAAQRRFSALTLPFPPFPRFHRTMTAWNSRLTAVALLALVVSAAACDRDGKCEVNEDCGSCSQDCGRCAGIPAPPTCNEHAYPRFDGSECPVPPVLCFVLCVGQLPLLRLGSPAVCGVSGPPFLPRFWRKSVLGVFANVPWRLCVKRTPPWRPFDPLNGCRPPAV